MADEQFVFSVVIRAENGELVQVSGSSKAAVKSIGDAAVAAGAGMRQLDGETKKATASAKADSEARREAKAAKDAEAAAAREAAKAQRELEKAQREAEKVANRQRAGMAQLGQQIQDVSYQFSAGVPPMIIFAQQGGQVAYALKDAGGAAGVLARFISGPYGSALMGAGLIVAAFAGQLSHAKEKAEEKKETLADLEAKTKDLTDAEKVYKELLGESILSQREATQQAFDLAQERYEAAIKTRELARAELDYAKAMLAAQQARASGPGQGNELAALGLAARVAEIERLEKKLDEADRRAGNIGNAWERALNRLAPAGMTVDAIFARTNGTLKKTKEGSDAAAKAAREAAREAEQYLKSLTDQGEYLRDATEANKAYVDQLTKRYDPLTDAARRYREELEKIGRLARTPIGQGGISAEQARIFRTGSIFAANDAMNDAINAPLRGLALPFQEAGAKFRKDVSSAGYTFAEALGDVIGGRGGRRVGGILRLGGFDDESSPFGKAFKSGWKEVTSGFGEQLSKIFGQNGSKFAGALGQASGVVMIGSQVGGLADGIMDAIGVKSSKLGAQLGGTIGAAVGGPIGAAIGAVGGGLIGGLFKSARTARANVTGVDSALGLGGKDKGNYDVASGLGGAVQQGIQQIAEALGGTVGRFNVTIGTRDNDFRVNTAGTSLKTGSGARNFGDDQAGAISYAIMAAIGQGGIAGLSAAVQKALKSSTDLDKAVKEAVLVQGVEQLLGGIAGAAKRAFTDFENTAKERSRVARQYGFDLVELERINAEQRAALFESQMQGAVGSLQRLLDSYKFGDNAGGTILDRRAALLAEAEGLTAKAPTDSAAADRLAQVLEMLQEVSTSAFGTAGAGAAGDRSHIVTTAERIVADTEARLRAEQDAARLAAGTDKAAEALQTTNATLDEISDQLAALPAALAAIIGQNGFGDLTAAQRLAIARTIGLGVF